jgi:hypothetical protein
LVGFGLWGLSSDGALSPCPLHPPSPPQHHPKQPPPPNPGQPEGLDIYTDHLATSDRFLSLKRYWMGGGSSGSSGSSAPAMDLGFLLDEVMVGVTPLDWEGVMAR